MSNENAYCKTAMTHPVWDQILYSFGILTSTSTTTMTLESKVPNTSNENYFMTCSVATP